ncbi:MAG: M15 family metallopeptidase, partial [Ideonella sp.]
TLDAIVAYQAAFLRKPDGVIDPGGTTWKHLSASYTGAVTDAPGETTALTRPVPRPATSSINIGLESAGNDFMLLKLGQPRDAGYSTLCQPPTHARLRRNFVTDTVGPFRVTGLVPAVLSLKDVMNDIHAEQPAVYRALGSAGMLCCRLVRGSTTSISNHSWGTAIDLTINGVLDVYGNDTVQHGLTLIAPIFNRHGWYWGAGFRTEDGMHFECSKDLLGKCAQGLA